MMEVKDLNFIDNCLVEILSNKKKDTNKIKASKDKQLAEAKNAGYQEAIDFVRYLCETYLLN